MFKLLLLLLLTYTIEQLHYAKSPTTTTATAMPTNVANRKPLQTLLVAVFLLLNWFQLPRSSRDDKICSYVRLTVVAVQ